MILHMSMRQRILKCLSRHPNSNAEQIRVLLDLKDNDLIVKSIDANIQKLMGSGRVIQNKDGTYSMGDMSLTKADSHYARLRKIVRTNLEPKDVPKMP